jgi:pre-mRNA-splicing factor SYF1
MDRYVSINHTTIKAIMYYLFSALVRVNNMYIIYFIFMFILKGGSKLERSRDLFEQCLEKCPAKFAKSKCHKMQG